MMSISLAPRPFPFSSPLLMKNISTPHSSSIRPSVARRVPVMYPTQSLGTSTTVQSSRSLAHTDNTIHAAESRGNVVRSKSGSKLGEQPEDSKKTGDTLSKCVNDFNIVPDRPQALVSFQTKNHRKEISGLGPSDLEIHRPTGIGSDAIRFESSTSGCGEEEHFRRHCGKGKALRTRWRKWKEMMCSRRYSSICVLDLCQDIATSSPSPSRFEPAMFGQCVSHPTHQAWRAFTSFSLKFILVITPLVPPTAMIVSKIEGRDENEDPGLERRRPSSVSLR